MKSTLILAAGLAFAALTANAQTLRFATWDSNESLEIQKSIAAMFEAAHPGVTVQVEAYGDGYDTKLAAGFGAGDAPDVMICGISRPMPPRFCRSTPIWRAKTGWT